MYSKKRNVQQLRSIRATCWKICYTPGITSRLLLSAAKETIDQKWCYFYFSWPFLLKGEPQNELAEVTFARITQSGIFSVY